MKFHPNSIEIAYVVYKISTPRNVGTSRKQKNVNNTIQRALSGEICNDDPNATVCCSLNSGRAPACGLRATRASGAGVPSRRVNAHACTRRRLRPVRERRTRARQPPRAASPIVDLSHSHVGDPPGRNHLSGHCRALRVVYAEISRVRCRNNFKTRSSHRALIRAYAAHVRQRRCARASDTDLMSRIRDK